MIQLNTPLHTICIYMYSHVYVKEYSPGNKTFIYSTYTRHSHTHQEGGSACPSLCPRCLGIHNGCTTDTQ